jgi:hypothetical protein
MDVSDRNGPGWMPSVIGSQWARMDVDRRRQTSVPKPSLVVKRGCRKKVQLVLAIRDGPSRALGRGGLGGSGSVTGRGGFGRSGWWFGGWGGGGWAVRVVARAIRVMARAIQTAVRAIRAVGGAADARSIPVDFKLGARASASAQFSAPGPCESTFTFL